MIVTGPVTPPNAPPHAAPGVTVVQAPPSDEPIVGEDGKQSPQSPENEGEVVVKARSRAGDPLQDFNVTSFNAAQGVDKAVLEPASKAYRKLPTPLPSGFSNCINNLREPVVFANYLLQHKVGKAAETVGRFAINTTVGLAGVLDVAKRKPFRLPRRRNSFANTLGFYGVKPGPFFFAPLLGPTTLRDLVGNLVDQAVPIGPIRPLSGGGRAIPIGILSALDYRLEIDSELERQRASEDPYLAARRFYLERRQAEIVALPGKGRVKKPKVKQADPTVPAVNAVEPIGTRPGATKPPA